MTYTEQPISTPTPAPVWLRVLRTMRRHFVLGIFVSVPLVLTILILQWAFNAIDSILQPFFTEILHISITGLGVATTIVLIYIVGAIASNVLGRRIIGWGESVLENLPIIRHLYSGVKQITDSFGSANRESFMRVVFVEFPSPGMKAVGFVTNESVSVTGEKLLNIFIPTAPNPTTGFLQILTEDKVMPTTIPVEEAIKLVVSAGRFSGANIAEMVEKNRTNGVDAPPEKLPH